MSRQNIGAAEREALWSAHGRKCAYTRKLLDVSNFHVDHIIPERLLDHPDDFAVVKNLLGLSSEFDIRGFENLLPCEPGSNLQKGDATLDPAHAHFFLNLASAKRASVEKNLESIKKRQKRGRALILLQQCMDSGELTREEVSRILDQHGDVPDSIFGLLKSMSFGDQVPVNEIAKDDIEDLRDRPLVFGNNSHISSLELTNADDEKICVKTCREYDNAISAGYTPISNFEMKMAVFCEHQCGLLNVLSYATQPLSSFIDSPRVGVQNLELMPSALFPFVFESDCAPETQETLKDKVDNGELVVRRANANSICLEEPEGMGQSLTEVVRADLTGDGIEDILLFEYCYATHGTLGYGGISAITRHSEHGSFVKLELRER